MPVGGTILTIDKSDRHANICLLGFNEKDDVMDKSFDSSSERDDALDRYEDKLRVIMRRAMRKALKDEGVHHYVRDGEIIIKKQHLGDELWEHRFTIEVYANHI